MKTKTKKKENLKKASGPSINRHSSKQNYSTPDDFMRAVIARFGPIVFDLAAEASNTKAAQYFDKATNSLIQDWDNIIGAKEGNLWLNPEFGDIAPWARKCALSKRRILMLTPASVGSNWFAEHVHGRALVLALSPRMSFDGTGAYPKDVVLSCYNYSRIGFECWRWK